jgi:hypothetical protein
MLVNIPYMDPMGILYSLSDHFLFFLFAKTRTLRTAWPRHVSGHLAGGERFHRTVPIGHQTCLGEFGGTAAVTEVPPSDYFNGQWRINIEIKKDGFRWYIYGLMMVISLNLGLWLYRGFIRKYLLKMVIFQFATSNHHRVSVEKPAEIPAVFCLFDFNLWISAYIITQYHTYIYTHVYTVHRLGIPMKTKNMWVFDTPWFRRIQKSLGWWFLHSNGQSNCWCLSPYFHRFFQDFADEQKEKADAAFKDGEYRRVPRGYLSQNKRFSLNHLVFGGCFMSPKPWNRDNTHWLWSCLVSIKTSVRSENARQKGG